MSQTETTTVSKIGIDLDLPRRYKVVLLNDDTTPMEFVISLLCEVFGHNEAQAENITMEVHHTGKGIAGIYYYEIAEQKVFEATTVSRAHGFPLSFEMEEE
jgi:ATP-dependent Clp protease adaptor protein ClpS